MATAKYKWTRAEEDALRDGVRKHGPGKWRTIQKDPELGDILRARSNVELKDKWRNMGEAGALDAAEATGGAEEEREASDREHAEGGGKRRRGLMVPVEVPIDFRWEMCAPPTGQSKFLWSVKVRTPETRTGKD